MLTAALRPCRRAAGGAAFSRGLDLLLQRLNKRMPFGVQRAFLGEIRLQLIQHRRLVSLCRRHRLPQAHCSVWVILLSRAVFFRLKALHFYAPETSSCRSPGLVRSRRSSLRIRVINSFATRAETADQDIQTRPRTRSSGFPARHVTAA